MIKSNNNNLDMNNNSNNIKNWTNMTRIYNLSFIHISFHTMDAYNNLDANKINTHASWHVTLKIHSLDTKRFMKEPLLVISIDW
jgi:hypothetical protein